MEIMKSKIILTEDIDWSKTQLVTGCKSVVVLSLGDHSSYNFKGVVVNKGKHDDPIGFFHENWAKSSFKLFDGKITLEND